MRSALITGQREGDAAPALVIAGPGIPRVIADHFKALLVSGIAGIVEIQLWDSGSGMSKRKKLSGEGEPLEIEGQEPELVGEELYESLTVAALKLAVEERELDPAGARLKQDFIDLLVAADKADADELGNLRKDLAVTGGLLEVALKENTELAAERDRLLAQLQGTISQAATKINTPISENGSPATSEPAGGDAPSSESSAAVPAAAG